MKHFLLFSFFSLLITNSAFALYPTEYKWYTINTPHFRIHFHDQYVREAQQLANYAERLYSWFDHQMQLDLYRPVEVVLSDASDQANGTATVFPYPIITISVSQHSFGFRKFSDWLEFVFAHEFAHIVQFTQCKGLWNIPYKMFGVPSIPSIIAPRWFREGWAVYIESKVNHGRATLDSQARGMMNAELLADNPVGLDVKYYADPYTPQNNEYRWYGFGGLLFDHLEKSFGSEMITRWIDTKADELSFGSAFSKTFGQDLRTAYNQLLYNYQDKIPRGNSPIKYQLITNSGYDKKLFCVQGDYLYFLDNQYCDASSWISRLNLLNGETERLLESNAQSLSPVANTNTFIYTEIVPVGKGEYRSDLFYFELNRRERNRLTTGARLLSTAVAPSSQITAIIENTGNRNLLKLMHLGSQKTNLLLIGENNDQYFAPCWSPDGSRLALASWSSGGYQDIVVYDLPSQSLQKIYTDTSLSSEKSPCFSPDGKTLYFVADAGSLQNIWAYKFENKSLYQLTDELTVLDNPLASADGNHLFFRIYTDHGWEIAQAEVRNLLWLARPGFELTVNTPESIGSTPESPSTNAYMQYAISRYLPLRYFEPALPVPMVWIDENGINPAIYLFNQDPIQHHSFDLTAGFGLTNQRIGYQLNYRYDSWEPTLRIELSDEVNPYTGFLSTGDGTYYQRNVHQALALDWSRAYLIDPKDNWNLGASFIRTHYSALSDTSGSAYQPECGELRALSLRASYQNTWRHGNSLVPEKGWAMSFRHNQYLHVLGSAFEFSNSRLGINYYAPGFQTHHSWELNASITAQTIDTPVQDLSSIDLPGYNSTALAGFQIWREAIYYHLPIWEIHAGNSDWDIYLRKIQLSIGLGSAESIDSAGNLTMKAYAVQKITMAMESWLFGNYTMDVEYDYGLSAGGVQQLSFGLNLPTL